MKHLDTILVLGAIGAVGYFIVTRQGVGAQTENSATGGTQQVAPPDLFGSILDTVNSIFQTVGKVAQTTQQTT